MSRRGRGADGRNGGADGFGRDGYRAGVRRIGLGRGRHRIGRHRADQRRDQQHHADVGHSARQHPAEPAAGWPGVDPVELDHLAGVPDEALSALVAEHGRCLWEVTSGDPPGWSGQGPPDRELAARLCAGCSVRAECVEFELRTAGADTVGVWGGLGEDDRRALHAAWSARTRPGQGRDQGRDQQEQRPASEGREDQDGGGW